MIYKSKTTQKIISGFLVAGIILPSVLLVLPKKTNAQTSSSAIADCVAIFVNSKIAEKKAKAQAAKVGAKAVPSNSTGANGIAAAVAGSSQATRDAQIKQCKDDVIKEILKIVARRVLQKMTEATVNWINSGFHGKPLFVENPASFFKDIAKSEIRGMVNMVGYNSSSHPFAKSFLINTINSFKSTFANNAQYSLSQVINDPILLEQYRTNFATGGWDAFILNTQYPQNNIIGSQIVYNDYLSKRLAGTTQSPAEKVKDILQQGQGFLSPQICVTNGKYKNGADPWHQPGPFPPPDCGEPDGSGDNSEYLSCIAKYNRDKAKWEENSCPNKPDGTSGFQTTTPGSVVASQIFSAMNSPARQTELSAALGNSLAAIFDALLNQFMQKGLSALGSKLSGSGSNQNDNFNYYGHTLGTSPNTNGGNGFNWGGPDEVIVLSTFKREVNAAIENGNTELRLIDTEDNPSLEVRFTPGFMQIVNDVWPKTQELDMCLPGPNLKWEERASEGEEDVSSFIDWLTSKIRQELPGSNTYLAAVDSIEATNDIVDELNSRKIAISETLIKLNSIKSELNTITTEPAPGSQGETTLKRLKERFNGMLFDLSTTSTISNVQNKIADAKDKLISLNTLINRCTTERTVKGWSNPGGADSTHSGGGTTQTERMIFCSNYEGGAPVNCDTLFRTNLSDYK